MMKRRFQDVFSSEILVVYTDSLPNNLVNWGMARQFEFEGFRLRLIDTRREINFEVLDEEGYVCRLVPRLYGFDISPLDQALGNVRALPLVPRISEFILHRDA
jgi:hypothetical protein